jgi:hypothetical protein
LYMFVQYLHPPVFSRCFSYHTRPPKKAPPLLDYFTPNKERGLEKPPLKLYYLPLIPATMVLPIA